MKTLFEGEMLISTQAMVRGSTKDQLGGNTPTQILNADIFLEQYYRLFGKDEDQILVDHYGHRESKGRTHSLSVWMEITDVFLSRVGY